MFDDTADVVYQNIHRIRKRAVEGVESPAADVQGLWLRRTKDGGKLYASDANGRR